jgi:hypothetical protein
MLFSEEVCATCRQHTDKHGDWHALRAQKSPRWNGAGLVGTDADY